MEINIIDFGALIAEIALIYEPLAENQGIVIDTEISDSLPSIQGDRARLMQCLQNLMDNAIRHTPAGGSVRISLHKQADSLLLCVSDTGSGIAAEHLPNIFERFYRADLARARLTGGTGLGLSNVRRLAADCGANIRVTSQPGHGTTFTLSFPLPDTGDDAS